MSEMQLWADSQSKSSAIALLLLMVLLGVFPLDVILPSFPALSEHFNTASSDIALSISLFAIGVSVSQFFLGPLSDQVGRKSLLITGLLISIIGAVGCANAVEFSTFMVFRVLQALGCGCFVLSNALVQDLFNSKERDSVRILMTSASGLLISVSPLAGVLLQNTLGWTGSFYVFALIASTVLLHAILTLPDPQLTKRDNRAWIGVCGTIFLNPQFMGLAVVAGIAFTCHFSFIAISPVIFLDVFELSQFQFALALLSYGVAYVVGGVVASRLQRTISHRQQLIAGLVLIGSAGVLLVCLSLIVGRGFVVVLLSMIVCTAGTTIVRPVATSRAMDIFPDSSGAAASMLNTVVFVTGGVLSAVVGLLVARFEVVLATLFILLCMTGLTIVLRLYRT
ncbi:MFS transporter [Pseudomonas caspiana]